MTNTNDFGADAAPHALAEKNLNNARRLLWEARSDERLFADAVRIFEESARLCGSIEATDRMKAHLLPVEGE